MAATQSFTLAQLKRSYLVQFCAGTTLCSWARGRWPLHWLQAARASSSPPRSLPCKKPSTAQLPFSMTWMHCLQRDLLVGFLAYRSSVLPRSARVPGFHGTLWSSKQFRIGHLSTPAMALPCSPLSSFSSERAWSWALSLRKCSCHQESSTSSQAWAQRPEGPCQATLASTR